MVALLFQAETRPDKQTRQIHQGRSWPAPTTGEISDAHHRPRQAAVEQCGRKGAHSRP